MEIGSYLLVIIFLLSSFLSSSVAQAQAGRQHAMTKTEKYAEINEVYFKLHTPEAAPFYTLVLPEDVYRFSTNISGYHMRVQNLAGENVPFTLEGVLIAQSETTSEIAVPWYPLPSNPERTELNNPIVGFKIVASGVLQAEVLNKELKEHHGEIIDVSQIKGRLSTLTLNFKESNYQGKVEVLASNDLVHWQPLATAQILKLNYERQELVQQKIQLDNTKARYLQLRWLTLPPEINDIYVTFTTKSSDELNGNSVNLDLRQSLMLSASKVNENANEYLLTSDGPFPFDQFEIRLPYLNTVVAVTVFARQSETLPWRIRGSGMLYRLQGPAGEQEQRLISLSPGRERYFMLSFDSRGGGIGSGVPYIKANWQSEPLTFLARGEGPYRLMLGKYKENGAQARNTIVISNEYKIISASINGSAIKQQQQPAIEEPEHNQKIRQIVLWLSLIIVVAFLGLFALRLARQT